MATQSGRDKMHGFNILALVRAHSANHPPARSGKVDEGYVKFIPNRIYPKLDWVGGTQQPSDQTLGFENLSDDYHEPVVSVYNDGGFSIPRFVSELYHGRNDNGKPKTMCKRCTLKGYQSENK